MLAEMTPGSKHTLSKKGSRTKDQRHTKSPCLRSCLTFCFKDRARMEHREPPLDSHVEGTEGRLRELAAKWFIETQVPLIVHNGLFPTWFLGFVTRKDAEEIFREKELGCFLIRLSDKAIGYILSYKGRDRCRHFMISQSESGQFVVCGDIEGHNSLADLIEHYKTNPIQPFGEYLTSSCFEVPNRELYDTIQVSPKEKPWATVGVMKNTRKPQTSEQPPARPPKSNRTTEEVPPLPRRIRNLDSGPLNDPDRVLYAQLRKQSPREIPRFQHSCQDGFPGEGRAVRSTGQDQNSRCSPPSGPESVYSELSLLDTKSRSLPRLDNSSDAEQSYRLSAPPHTPPRLSPKPVRETTYFGQQLEKTDSSSRASSSHSMEHMSDGAVYHLAGKPGSPHTTSSHTRSSAPEQHSDSVYAEVPDEAVISRFPHDNTYELIPCHEDAANTYEPLEDIRPKHHHSSWGLKQNDKPKWLFPEVKRKW
ncbi:SH2 domain-containing protein 7-like isoform X2 [Plectropomus leopardus]|uniref:SH2 domain-containing protein 7-like isoform X2 n=2 Tax=Plectropomus leopardus TaxID=160734 RepID=UPI001C4C92B2|nr:SH2 domain-containing protein 7-like isoform X2 [Plectropomus leopardus]